MSPAAIALIGIAAIAHATWNLFSKQASTTGAVLFVWLLGAGASVAYLPVAAITVALGHPHLTGLNWLFLVATGVIQSGYFLFLQFGYSLGDLSVMYPVGRGAGATLAAIAGIAVLGERPHLIAIIGIVAIIGGVIVIGLPSTAEPTAEPSDIPATTPPARHEPAITASPHQPAVAPGSHDPARPTDQPSTAPTASKSAAPTLRAIGFALIVGVFIASYTIVDKYAVTDLHTPPVLQGYACFPVMMVVFAPFAARDRARLTGFWRCFKKQVLGAVLLVPLAYMLVLTALRFTAVSAVAPAREVSVLFGVLLGGRLLGEKGLARRLAAAAAIVAGIIAIAIG